MKKLNLEKENEDLKVKIGSHVDKIIEQQAVIDAANFCIEQIEWGDSSAYKEYQDALSKII